MAQLHTGEMLNVSQRIALSWRVDCPSNSSVHEDLISAAITSPAQIALTGDEGSLTYAELSRRAQGFALRLRQEGLGSGSLLGLAASRSFSKSERDTVNRDKLTLREGFSATVTQEGSG